MMESKMGGFLRARMLMQWGLKLRPLPVLVVVNDGGNKTTPVR